MARMTKDDIRKIVEEEDVEFIRMQFTDIFGQLKMSLYYKIPARESHEERDHDRWQLH